MGNHDPRVDAYIVKAAGFARPILKQIRKVVHAGCPAVTETIKWGFPHFEHKGILCSMAAFTEHCAFGFWKKGDLAKKHGVKPEAAESAMGQFGRITALSDLPEEKTLLRLVKAAAAMNEQGIKAPRRAKPAKRGLAIPNDFMSALRKNKKALATFDAFSPSNKREYVEWVTEAKGEATRARRLETAITWMAEGKIRNWKYVRS